MEFEQWWKLMCNVFNMENLTHKELAKVVWECATENEKQKALETIDEIMCSDNTHRFYKKHPEML